jgi:Mrp family chromosome partitioning ATPase
VILLEADLRRPMLDAYLGLNRNAGFTDLLSGRRTVSDVVQVLNTDKFLPQHDARIGAAAAPDETSSKRDLLYISSGPLPPNPAELLATGRVNEVLTELTAVCDQVVIDAPPILLVSDALEVAKKVDGVILVARMRASRVDEARMARQTLERIGVKPLGVIVAGVERTKTYYHRYGGEYTKPSPS